MIKIFINKRIRKYFRFRNYLPKIMFGRVFTEVLLGHMEPVNYMDGWPMKPFNGQVRRLMQISLIANKFKPNYAIETGTYLGTTTIYLAAMVTEQTYTIEINKKRALSARRRFEENYSDLMINCFIGDSILELTRILKDIPTKDKRLIAYLDSHGYGILPTTDELQALNNWGQDWIAIIDDFKVNTDPGYGFDIYNGVEVGLSIVPELPGLQVWVTKENSILETGAKRGTGYVFTDKSASRMDQNVMLNLQRVR